MPYTEEEHWVKMNDGVRLDASVCTPEGKAPEGGWPAVLMAHGHGDAGSKASMLGRGRRYADLGYLAVCYSVRGQGDSEGLVFHMGARETFDLQDVVKWALGEQPIHPDRLGVVGSSQGGWHAYMAAAHCPEVATVVAENIFTDYSEFVVHNGCLTKWFFTRTMRRRILTAGLQDMARQYAVSGDWERLRAWVDVTSPANFADRITCPVFIVHGWHDVGMPPNEPLEMFEALNVPKKLYLGGGGHDGKDDPEAAAERERLTDQWLDHWLKGHDNATMDEPPITYALRPGWTHARTNSLPGAGMEVLMLYPHHGGRLEADAPDGPSTHSNITNRPLDPDYGLKQALFDDMEGVDRALARETTAFTSDVYEAPIEILGNCSARLFLMPNREWVQVNVELVDVGSDDSETVITRSQWGTRRADPGRHLEAAFDLRTIAYRLEAGHRLRLKVSNYDTEYAVPYFEPFVARLYQDSRFASSVEIPVRRETADGRRERQRQK